MFFKKTKCACENSTLPDPNTKRVVTLVHGTFAKHAPWIQDGHRLTKTLSKVSGTVLDRFCWSGRNLHTSRLNAGDDFRKHLVNLISSYKDAGVEADHHVISHSHGGNVALYALRDRGDADDSLLANVKLITLATPFLFMRERKSLPFWILAVLPLYLVISCLFSTLAAPLSIIMIVWCSIGIIAFPLSLLIYRIGRSSLSPSLWQLIRNKGRTTLDEAKLITVPKLDSDRIFVIRGLGDEASGGLGAAQLTNWLMTRLLTAFSNLPQLILKTFMAGFALAVFVAVIGPYIDEPNKLIKPITNTLAGFSLAVIIVPLTVLPLIAGLSALSNLPFGIDTLFWNYRAQTTAEQSPQGISRVLVVGMRQFHYDDLSHGVYQDEEAIRAIIEQIGSWSEPRLEAG